MGSRLKAATKPVVESLEQRLMLSINAPTALHANGSITPGSDIYIALDWDDNSDNESGFKIERKTGSGGTWSQIGTADANATTYNDSTISPGVSYVYRLRATRTGEDSSYSNQADAVEWTSTNLGSATGGSWSVSNGVGTLVSNGNGMAGGVDNARFAYRTLNGDGQIIARVTSVQWTNPMARAAIMMRNSLASNSRSAFLAIMPNGSAQWSFRRTDGASAQQSNISNQAAPRYVKLVRFGSMITASVSADKTTWTQVGQANISMNDNIYVGLALSASEYYGGYNTSTFDQVAVTDQGHPLPSGWSDLDIGTNPVPGTARYEDGSYLFTVEGSGHYVGGTSDNFNFAHRTLNGDGQIIAHIGGFIGTDGNPAGYNQFTMAGVMFRDGTAANARTAMMAVTGWDGARWQYRTTTGGNSTETKQAGITLPYWVKLTRVGNTFTGYISSNGTTWSQVGSPVTISNMPVSLEVGLMFNAAAYGSLITTKFDHVRISPSTAPTLLLSPADANRIAMSWDYTSTADGFVIERKDGIGGKFVPIQTVAGNVRALDDETVTPGPSFYYRIRSFVNSGGLLGYSPYSSEVSATTNGLGDGLAAAIHDDANFFGDPLSRVDKSISFHWGEDQSPDPAIESNTFSISWMGQVQPPATGTYTFHTLSDDGVRLWVNDQLIIDEWAVQSPTHFYGTSDLVGGNKYNLRIEYFQNYGSADLQLMWATAGLAEETIPTGRLFSTGNTASAPDVPANVVAIPGSNPSRIDLSWDDVSGATFYAVYRSSDGGKTYGAIATVSATGYIDVSVDPSELYFYRVLAVGAGGRSAFAQASAASLPAVPSAPSDIAGAARSDGGIHLTWIDNSSNEMGFKVERSDDGIDFAEVGITSANSSYLSDNTPGMAPGTSYYYRVRAYNEAGDSSCTNAVSIATMTLSEIATAGESGMGLTATYFDNADFTGTKLSRVDGDVNFAWQSASPDPSIQSDTYSARWAGLVTAAADGDYIFRTVADDGTRLWIDNVLVIDNWVDVPPLGGDTNLDGKVTFGDYQRLEVGFGTANPSWANGDFDADGDVDFDDFMVLYGNYGKTVQPVTAESPMMALLAGVPHDIKLEFYEGIGYSSIRLEWSSDGGQTFAPVDSAALQPLPTPGATPSAPSGLVSTGLSSSLIDLAWTDNSSNEAEFRVEGSADGSDYFELATLGPNATQFRYGAALPNALHYLRVRAQNSVGASAWSNVSTALTFPAAPDGLYATATSATSVALVWDSVTDLNSYVLERRVDGGDWQTLPTQSGSADAYTDSGLNEGTTYSYHIRAANSSGDSAFNPETSVITLPAAPSGLSVSAGSQSQLPLSWTDNSNGEDGYIVQVSDGGSWQEVGRTGANTASFQVQDLAAGTSYTFRVLAFNSSGTSVPSGTSSGTTTPAGWTTFGEASVSGQTVTLKTARGGEGTSEPSGYHGASFLMAPAAQYVLDVTLDLKTWDSYSAFSGGATGYFDAFSISADDKPYTQLSVSDPLNFPFVWGGSSYRDGVQDTKSETRTITLPGDPTKPKYLNVALKTDGVDPSWGTVTISTSLTAADLPCVTIKSTAPQAAEAGSPGQFTVHREGGDVSSDLVVEYEVSTRSTASATDYSSLSGTVTIPANAMDATIDLTATKDPIKEGNETVVLSLKNKNNYVVRKDRDATIAILDTRPYLVGFYGIGPVELAGNHFVDELMTIAATPSNKRVFHHNDEPKAFAWLFDQIDADKNMRISKAEAESTVLRVYGFSWGGIQAINFTRKLTGVGKTFSGYRIEHEIGVEALVTVDPVAFYWFLKKANGPVKANVKKYVNYRQDKAGESTMQLFSPFNGAPAGSVTYGIMLPFASGTYKGSVMASDVADSTDNVVNTKWPNEVVFGDTSLAGGIKRRGELKGSEVNHETMPFWTRSRVADDLAEPYFLP